jgi:predicted amidohydrolase
VRGIAEKNKVLLYAGIIEKDENGGGTLYCTGVLIGTDGTLLSSHRKVFSKYFRASNRELMFDCS